VHSGFDALARRYKLPPLVVDTVEAVRGEEYDLRISSCRPKPDWNKHITVEFEDQFYQLRREETVDGPRPYVFCLRKNPVGRLVVVVRKYKADDVLKRPGRKTGLDCKGTHT
jgi:hypothetical protein